MKRDKNKINILVVSSKYPPEPSGSGFRAHSTYKRLAAKFNFNYEVLSGSVMFNKVENYSQDGIKVRRIARKLFTKNVKYQETLDNSSLWRSVKNGINYFIEKRLTEDFLSKNGSRFDLFHVFGHNNVTTAVLMYAKRTKKPVILEICNQGSVIEKRVPPDPDWKIVCISKSIKDAWDKNGFTNKLWCRPNPVDSSKFFIDIENKYIFRKRLGLFGDKDIVLLSVGKIRPLKNQIFLIDVLKDLPDKYKLVIAGPSISDEAYAGRERSHLDDIKKRIDRYGLTNRVKIKDKFIDNVDEYMKASDIYLLPSKKEACATAVLEAMACGIPVVGHEIKGVTTEWIKDGVNGYLVPLEVPAFRKNIERATSLDAEHLRESLKEVIEMTSPDGIDRKYANLIREIAA